MNLVMVTLLALGAEPVPPGVPNAPMPQAMGEMEPYECNCDECRARRAGGPGIAARVGAAYHHLAHKVAVCAMEPQTSYNPRFGCYGSNDRFMHRYPAFHGHYYRRPYNYRAQFDYPWHAELHEPTSLFSYNFGNAGPGPMPTVPEEVPRSTRRDPQAAKPSRPLTLQPVSIQAVKTKYSIKDDDDSSPADRP